MAETKTIDEKQDRFGSMFEWYRRKLNMIDNPHLIWEKILGLILYYQNTFVEWNQFILASYWHYHSSFQNIFQKFFDFFITFPLSLFLIAKKFFISVEINFASTNVQFFFCLSFCWWFYEAILGIKWIWR